MNKDIEKI